MGADHIRRAMMVSVVMIFFLAGPVLLPYAAGGSKTLDISRSVPFLSFGSYQIYGGEDGKLEVRFQSDIPVHLFIFEEEEKHTIQDALQPGGKGNHLLKKESVTALNFTLKTRSSTNHYIIVQNYGSHYNRSAVIRLHADSSYDEGGVGSFNWNYLYLLLVPLVLIPVIIWIRKRA